MQSCISHAGTQHYLFESEGGVLKHVGLSTAEARHAARVSASVASLVTALVTSKSQRRLRYIKAHFR
jgi:hypothetical protein